MSENFDLSTLSDEELVFLGFTRNQQAAAAKAKADEVKDEIRRRMAGVTQEVFNRVEVKIAYPRRFAPDLAKQVLTPNELEQITVPTLDGKRAKELFGMAQYELMSRADTPRVSFKII